MDGFGVALHTSDAAWPEAVGAAVLYQDSAKARGINLDVRRDPGDSYWDNVWMKVPFCMSTYNGRPTANLTLSLVYYSKADWNDARWQDPAFDKLLIEARAELDFEKRKAMYWEMQRMINTEGGHLVPVFADFFDASKQQLKGFVPNPLYEMAGFRLAEQAWVGA
jgi:peptide/nickel transport system substrate-binding protein